MGGQRLDAHKHVDLFVVDGLAFPIEKRVLWWDELGGSFAFSSLWSR
jgi:hypothetical protein